jgi:hypothetical protein
VTGDETNELNQLIDRVADGEADPAEQQRLDAILAGSSAARGELESLRGVVSRLASVPLIEPPPALAEDVLTAVRERTALPHPESRAVIAKGTTSNRRRWGMLTGWAVAAAIMAVAFLPRFESLVGRSPAGQHAGTSGAMVPLAGGAWKDVVRASSPAGIEAIVRRDRDQLRLDVKARAGAGLTVAWDPARLTLADREIPSAAPAGARLRVDLKCGLEGCEPLVFHDRHAGPLVLTLTETGGDVLDLSIPEP